MFCPKLYIAEYIALLHSIYCFTLKPKSLSFLLVLIRFHSFSFVVPLVVICCHLFSLAVTRCTTCYHSLSFVTSLVVTGYTTRCHSLSMVVPLFVTRLPLVCLFINNQVSDYKIVAQQPWNFIRTGITCKKWNHGTIIRTGITCKKIPYYMRNSACRWFIAEKTKIF